MRLANFILEHRERILAEWEDYARSIWPEATSSPEDLRDHAEEMLIAVAANMANAQTAAQQSEKSMGRGDDRMDSRQLDASSLHHAENRLSLGFDLQQLVAEYRALRASVIRLWRQSAPESHRLNLDDIIRFNEAIDQLLAESTLVHTQQINRSRELFLGVLGHDLRNPLSAVAMHAEVLRLKNLDPFSAHTAVQISKYTASMRGMINDLLEFAAMRTATSAQISPGPMDLISVCRESLDEMKAIYSEDRFRFEHQGELNGEWDEPRLKQLLSNLLGNAAKHGAENQPVILSIEGTDAEAVIAVRNQGPQIPEDQIPTLFKPMKNYGSGKARDSSGSMGLGLYIAHEIVVAHGGSIQAKSDAQETVLTVHLPRVCSRAPFRYGNVGPRTLS